jgi:hypothetical protein
MGAWVSVPQHNCASNEHLFLVFQYKQLLVLRDIRLAEEETKRLQLRKEILQIEMQMQASVKHVIPTATVVQNQSRD